MLLAVELQLIVLVVVMASLLSDIKSNTDHSINCPQPLQETPGGVYTRCIQDIGGMTATHKLIFVASFFWMMNWGVRVTSVLLDKL